VALGGTPIAIFSPAVRFLFAEQADLNDCLQRLRAAGVRFIVLPPASDDISEQHLRRYPFFRQLAAVPPVAGLRLGRVYDLFADAVAPRGKTESAGTGPSAPPPPNR
jgi:hypothetical protein